MTTSTEQPEALRLRLAAEGHIALCKKFGPEGFHFHADPRDVLAILDRVQELEAERAAIIAEKDEYKVGLRAVRAELEASQAQRAPLPLSEILHFAGEHGFVNIQGGRAFCAFVDGTDVAFELEALARDIERAHGITQEKQG